MVLEPRSSSAGDGRRLAGGASGVPASPPPPGSGTRPRRGQRRTVRLIALAEVTLCSGFPTQLAIIGTMAAAGLAPTGDEGRLALPYVLTLLLADAAVLLGLIFLFLRLHGESPRELFLGSRHAGREAAFGLASIPFIVALVLAVLAFIRTFLPWMHNVPENPLEDLIQTPIDAATFAVVAVIAGGVREEMQRAFVLRRFEQHLGGPILGLIVFSALFGAGHALQGWDAAVATALLGAIWGILYLVRRSVIAPMVSHAGFNLAEIARYAFLR